MSIHATFWSAAAIRYTPMADDDAPLQGHVYFCEAGPGDRIRITIDSGGSMPDYARVHITRDQLLELRDKINLLLQERTE